jgi:hypothetical protein
MNGVKIIFTHDLFIFYVNVESGKASVGAREFTDLCVAWRLLLKFNWEVMEGAQGGECDSREFEDKMKGRKFDELWGLMISFGSFTRGCR